MVQIVSKKIVKVFSVMIAALVMLGAALLFTACETNYPQIKSAVAMEILSNSPIPAVGSFIYEIYR